MKIIDNKITESNSLSKISINSNRSEKELYRLNPDLKGKSEEDRLGYIVYIPTSKWSKPKYKKSTSKQTVQQHTKDKPNTQVCRDSNGKIFACKKCVPPPWMEIAKAEMNKHVQRNRNQGKRGNNPIIMKYHDSTKLKKYVPSKKYNEGQSWCGTFVNYVMKTSGYKTFLTTFRAKDWSKYGKKISKPIYGAIGVKSRVGGGHVAFVVGVDNVHNPKYIYMLGGNQWGKPNNINWGVKTTKYLKKQKKRIPYIKSILFPSRYKISDWSGFYVPKEYDNRECKLQKYTGKYIISLSDGS
jgi:uncharacterized protein (TIGR02594 family)